MTPIRRGRLLQSTMRSFRTLRVVQYTLLQDVEQFGQQILFGSPGRRTIGWRNSIRGNGEAVQMVFLRGVQSTSERPGFPKIQKKGLWGTIACGIALMSAVRGPP